MIEHAYLHDELPSSAGQDRPTGGHSQSPGRGDSGRSYPTGQPLRPAKKPEAEPGQGRDALTRVVDASARSADLVAATIAERGKVYGAPHESHVNIGLSWTGLIQQHYGIKLDHPLPASVVELMMALLKAHRSARVYRQDNFVDFHAYADFAEESQQIESGTLTRASR